MYKKMKGFWGVLRQEQLRVLGDWKIYGCILLYAAVCIVSARQFTGNTVIVKQAVLNTLSNMDKILILVAALPTACIFCDDWLGSYTKPCVMRSSSGTYILAKAAICVLSTFVTSCLGQLLFCLIEAVKYPIVPYESWFSNMQYRDIALGKFPFLYIVIQAVLFSLICAVYALYGLALSSIMPNRFVAMAAPVFSSFVISELSHILAKVLPYISIDKLQRSGRLFPCKDAVNSVVALSLIAGYMLIAVLIFNSFTGRRIRNEIV